MNCEEVKKLLLENGETKIKEFNEKLIPGSAEILGYRLPQLHEIAAEISKGDYREFLTTNDFSYYELGQLHGMVICRMKGDIDDILEYVKAFIPHINDWSVNDSFCTHFKIARKSRVNQEKVFAFLQEYVDSDKEYEQRVVAVMLMSQFLNDDYIDRVIEILDKLKIKEYYAKMGVAWAVATVMAKYPDKCMDYLKGACPCGNHLDDWTYNKAIQKMLESYRVSDELKAQLRTMKRRTEPKCEYM